MAKKQDSEFRAWFVAQHGQRPSPAETHELQAEYMRAQELLNTRRRLLEQCNDYDARETSALYAWQAARSNDRVEGRAAASSRRVPSHDGLCSVPTNAAVENEMATENCARNELVVTIHDLASNFENALYAFGNDTEARKKAEGDIAHAMKVAGKHNQNGPGCPMHNVQGEGAEPLLAQLPSTAELAGTPGRKDSK